MLQYSSDPFLCSIMFQDVGGGMLEVFFEWTLTQSPAQGQTPLSLLSGSVWCPHVTLAASRLLCFLFSNKPLFLTQRQPSTSRKLGVGMGVKNS